MKLQRVVFALIGMMFLFAAKSSAQQVKTDYDRGVNFGQYKTYSWARVKTKDALDVDRIKNAVNDLEIVIRSKVIWRGFAPTSRSYCAYDHDMGPLIV